MGWRSCVSARPALKPTSPAFASHGRRMAARSLGRPAVSRLPVRPHRTAMAHGAVGARSGPARHEWRWTRGRPGWVIADLKARETGGLIDLPRPPKFRPAIACESYTAPSPATSVLCWDEAAGADRGLAGDPGRLAAGDAGRRFGRAGVVTRFPSAFSQSTGREAVNARNSRR